LYTNAENLALSMASSLHVTMTVFIKESRYGDKFEEVRKDFF